MSLTRKTECFEFTVVEFNLTRTSEFGRLLGLELYYAPVGYASQVFSLRLLLKLSILNLVVTITVYSYWSCTTVSGYFMENLDLPKGRAMSWSPQFEIAELVLHLNFLSCINRSSFFILWFVLYYKKKKKFNLYTIFNVVSTEKIV